MQVGNSYSTQVQALRKENTNNNVSFQANLKNPQDVDAFFKNSENKEKKSNTLKYLGYAALGAAGVATLAYFHPPTGNFFKGLNEYRKSFLVSAEKSVETVTANDANVVVENIAPPEAKQVVENTQKVVKTLSSKAYDYAQSAWTSTKKFFTQKIF